MTEIRSIAKDNGINPTRLRKADLIHAIQVEEHNDPCYATMPVDECDQIDCLWRADCERAMAVACQKAVA
jgi:hypothetical protein